MNTLRRLLAILAVQVLFAHTTAQALTCTDATIPPSNPDSVYTVNSDGTVSDTRNGLIWKQCAEGQSGSTCSGSATNHSWSAALSLAAASRFAGHSDWRLPNAKELLSLVEDCRIAPSINDAVFPATPSSVFWSGSPYAYYSYYAWVVLFGSGGVGNGGRYYDGSVRLVRGGQSFGSFDGLGGGTGSAAFTPATARLDAEQTFTFTGTGLPLVSVTIEDCGTGKIASDNTFKCQPTLPGNKSVTVNGTVLDSKVFFDHPTRTGNPASRGIPSVKGVSLWNGNFHHEVVDMEVPGQGLPFVLSRSYNSYYWDKEKARGSVDNYQPWCFNWDLKIGYIGGDTTRLYAQREDGSGASFFKEGGVWYPIDQGSFDTLQGNFDGHQFADGLTTLTTRDGRLYVFMNPDQGGKLMMVKDRDGHTLTLHYDNANGKVSSVTDTVGRTFVFGYDSANRLRQVADASNAAFKVQYTWEADNPPNNPNTSPLLRERIASVTDMRGNTTTYNYAFFTTTNPDIGPRIFLTRITDPRTNHPLTLTYTDTVYGDWGVASLTDVVNSTWRFKFCAENPGNPCGTLDKTIGFRSDVTAPAPFTASGFSAHFDTAGRYTGKTDGRQNNSVVTPYPTANLLSTNYGLAGLKAASQTPRNNQTHHAYTPDGNEQSRTQADTGVLKKTWVKAAANLYKLTASTSPADVLRTMDYNATGKLTSHRVASLPAATQSYDPSTQLLKQSTDTLGNPTAYTYDAQGNLLTSTDALNQVTQHQYDSQGRVTRSIDPAGVITETTYDTAGNVLNQYDENGNQTKHTDPLGNITTMI